MNEGFFKKVKLVFDGWELAEGMSFDSKKLLEASLGSFHYGTVFDVDFYARKDEIEDLQEQLKKGLRPRFIIVTQNNKGELKNEI